MPSRTRSMSGRAMSKRSSSLIAVVDSPPGATRASTRSSAARVFTAIARAPLRSSAAMCSLTSPCTASTPTSGGRDTELVPASREQFVLAQGAHVDAVHRTPAGERLVGCDDGGRVLEVRRRVDDGARVAQRDAGVDARVAVRVDGGCAVLDELRGLEDAA